MKVLFIGGTGNISTAVSKLAVSSGIDLYLLNRGKTRQIIFGAKTITCDITDIKELKKTLNNRHWDVVVNWIAFTVDDIKRDIDLFYGRTKQYIFISSASAYQKPLSYPIVTESTPLANPFWEYSRNKIACEDVLNKEYRERNFPVTIVRPSHTYDTVVPVSVGKWNDYTMMDRMERGKKIIVHGDGTSLWTLTHSEDFAKGFLGLIGHQQAIGHAFHITSNEILNWNQIYETMASTLGVKIDIIHISSDFICRYDESYTGTLLGDKAYSVIFDNSKIKKFVPGFTATITFKEGFKRTIAWFNDNPEYKTVDDGVNKMLDSIISAYERKLQTEDR
jgi:nucleoside-diphosphate-sugar epimerase